MSDRPTAHTRAQYRHFLPIQTRWSDNDAYGHVNNVVYYSYFDTVVNEYLIRFGELDPTKSDVFGVVVETSCRFLRELTFPEVIDAGLRVARLGNTSIVYEIGLFRSGEARAAAFGRFVHVYVDRASRRPTPIPPPLHAAARRLLPDEA